MWGRNRQTQELSIQVGARGECKSYGYLLELAKYRQINKETPETAEIIKDDFTPAVTALQQNNPFDNPTSQNIPNGLVWASGGGGGSNTPGTGYYPFAPAENVYQNPSVITKKQEFNPDDHRGKFCAVCTITYMGIDHTGVLFVKKCGHWKLCEFNGNKLAGGNAGSFDKEIKNGSLKIMVLHTIYDADRVEPTIGADELEIT